MAGRSLRAEATELLQALLRVETVNPPGNETAAAELLRDYLADSGVECGLYARARERANLVARLPGRDPDAPRLLLLAHTDTVHADPAEWQVDPWSGALRDGEVWGRGALDMKGQAAASAVALAALAREGFEPSGDLVFAATADEEVGAGFGLSWLCEAHPELVRATWCVNEGGGDRIVLGGRSLYLCATAEKTTSPFVLRVRGRSSHASVPALGDNALVKAAALVARLGSIELPIRSTPEARGFLDALGIPPDELGDALDELRVSAPGAAAMLEPLLRTTIAPTQIAISSRGNVIPARCDVVCDCRFLPDEDRDEVEQAVRAHLGPGDYELEWLDQAGGSRSAPFTPLWEAIEGFLAREDPGAAAVPILLPGFTDSHYLRQTFGTIAYGFFPMRTMPAELAARLIHSPDERVPVDDLELGTRFLIETARSLLG